jgi:hypothetical protein
MGMLNNYGDISTIYNWGTFNNFATLIFSDPNIKSKNHHIFNNMNTVTISSGTFNNYDTINNSGTINNRGTLDIKYTPYGTINNEGTINNKDTINNSGLINNSGIINNSLTFNNCDSGIVENTGSINGNEVIENCNYDEETSLEPTPEPIAEQVVEPTPEPIAEQVVNCGTGTESVNGICQVIQTEEKSSKGGGCLIATATYGSELSPQVQQLRELRDNQLLQTESGTAFMGMFNDVYYSFSPIIADYERENPVFKEAVKLAIAPMISSLSLLENAESESEVLGIGISVIMLNLGMYFGVPAVVIVGIRKITQID